MSGKMAIKYLGQLAANTSETEINQIMSSLKALAVKVRVKDAARLKQRAPLIPDLAAAQPSDQPDSSRSGLTASFVTPHCANSSGHAAPVISASVMKLMAGAV